MKMSSKTPEYQSGSCNIAGAEVRSLIFSHSHWLPLAVIGWYQSRRKFFLAFGLSGVFNFGNLGEISQVADPAQRSADRAQALKMLAQATLTAAVFALILTFIPA